MSRSKTKDMFKGKTPPLNTHYHIVLLAKGESYLRGWMKCDRQSDPEGHKIRFGHYAEWRNKEGIYG